ncbi:MAG: cytochrome b/b6 domain-containing protein [Methylotenera sp.]
MTALKVVKVWDPIVRIGHWALVIAFFTAYLTEDDLLTQHTWAGYAVATIIFIRIIWGFIGSRYAKFSQFMYRPPIIIQYIKNLLSGKAQHYVGHNPAGGAMVVALLFSLIITVISGMKLYAVEENKGPFATIEQVLFTHQNTLSDTLNMQKHTPKEEDEEFWEEIHETFVNITLILIILHVGGVIASSIIDKEKLVKAMWTGKKEVDDSYH